MKQVAICTLRESEGKVQATLTPAGGRRGFTRSEVGETMEQAIGMAFGEPCLRFASSGDELEVKLATVRGHACAIMARGKELLSLGIRTSAMSCG